MQRRGSAKLANWARAIVVIEPIDGEVFQFIGAKRGPRLQWTDGNGERTMRKLYKYATDGTIYWQPAG